MEINQLDIVDNKGNILMLWSEELGDEILCHDNIIMKWEGGKILIMIKDYEVEDTVKLSEIEN